MTTPPSPRRTGLGGRGTGGHVHPRKTLTQRQSHQSALRRGNAPQSHRGPRGEPLLSDSREKPYRQRRHKPQPHPEQPTKPEPGPWPGKGLPRWPCAHLRVLRRTASLGTPGPCAAREALSRLPWASHHRHDPECRRLEPLDLSLQGLGGLDAAQFGYWGQGWPAGAWGPRGLRGTRPRPGPSL